MIKIRKQNKSGQVWIETVLYTLIGLVLIGLALGFIMKKINEARDKALVEQAINSLAELDSKITEVIETGTGNVRQLEFFMKKGELYINATNNEIEIVLTGLSKLYSEPGLEINSGRIKIKSESGQKKSTTYLRVAYETNITYNSRDIDKKFSSAPTAYQMAIENLGNSINIKEISGK